MGYGVDGKDLVLDRLYLDPSWPGLDAPSGQIEVDPDVLIEFADRMDREADFLEGSGAGTPSKLEADTSLPCAAFGTWQTAYEMESGHNEARRYVTHYFRQLVTLMREVAGHARATAAAHQGTDQGIQDAIQNQQSAMSDQDQVQVG